jgi:hypothetical protein
MIIELEYPDSSVQIPTNVLTLAGESPRALTIVSEDDSRVKWSCHRYVRFAAGFKMALDGIIRRDLRSHHGFSIFDPTRLRTRVDDIRRLVSDQTRRLAT